MSVDLSSSARSTARSTAPGNLSLPTGVARQLAYWSSRTKATWKASIASSFVAPFVYVVAMGVLLGGFIPGDPARLEGATSYLEFVVPGLVVAQAMQTAVSETTYPVYSMFKWDKVYEAMLATPLGVRDLVTAHLLYAGFRVATTSAVYFVVLAPFGVFATWWGPVVAYLATVLVGLAFASLTYAFTCRIKTEAAFGVLFRIGVFPLFLFSGSFFPITNLGHVGAWVARCTPLWQGVNLARMFCVRPGGDIDVSTALVNVAVLLALTALGWRLALSGLQRKMVR